MVDVLAADEPGYGYDPTQPEPFEATVVRYSATIPNSASVNPAYLPPVGQQGTAAHPGAPGSCAAWASTYGLATFVAARSGSVDPAVTSDQASPAAIYIQSLQQQNSTSTACTGSRFSSYFQTLGSQGAAAMSTAPYQPDCQWLWSQYAQGSPAPDPRFRIGTISCVDTSDLDSIRQVIAAGNALAYGTGLYTDWPQYAGDPDPYVGNKQIMRNREGKPAGHCLLIIGYDGDAIRVQNSEGTAWGASGYANIAYETFQLLAQGKAFFVAD